MDKQEYDEKVRSLLSDTRTYKQLPRNPAASLERRMNELLLSLNRAGSIPDHLYKQLRSASGATPLLYGLPKIHKPEVPLRPIASFINSPSYQLSKHLVHLLAPLVGKTSSFIKNSTDFAAFISDQTIAEETILVSFDVVSLFTNVPVRGLGLPGIRWKASCR